MLKNVKNTCNCMRKNCVRYGKCSECLEYHKDKKRPPYCKRPKVTLLDKQLKEHEGRK